MCISSRVEIEFDKVVVRRLVSARGVKSKIIIIRGSRTRELAEKIVMVTEVRTG